MKLNVSVEEARQILLQQAVCLKETEWVALVASLGRIAGASINAPHSLPLFDKSPLDGYAMRAEDIQNADKDNPVKLTVIEEYRAGYIPTKTVGRGNASKLMTGAPMPEGADVVIKYEDIERIGEQIHVFYPLAKDSNVIFAGEDIQTDERLVERGERITAAHIGMLSSVGVEGMAVQRKIKVALLSTGDEVISRAADLAPGKIFNSNLPFLGAAVQNIGTDPLIFGAVHDDKQAIISALETALRQADIVVTTGGVSVGDYDFIPECIEAVGGEVLFKGVCLKPGSPAIAAKVGDKLILGLSGNAAAASITFQLLAVPLLKKMMGQKEVLFPMAKAILLDGFAKKSPQRRFLRGRFIVDDDQNKIALTGSQTNGAVKSSVGCNALIDVAAGSDCLCAGQEVRVVLTGAL